MKHALTQVNACDGAQAYCEISFFLRKDAAMLQWALIFLVVGLIAGVLGFSGIAGAATQIAWILFVVGIILFIVFMVLGRRPKI